VDLTHVLNFLLRRRIWHLFYSRHHSGLTGISSLDVILNESSTCITANSELITVLNYFPFVNYQQILTSVSITFNAFLRLELDYKLWTLYCKPQITPQWNPRNCSVIHEKCHSLRWESSQPNSSHLLQKRICAQALISTTLCGYICSYAFISCQPGSK